MWIASIGFKVRYLKRILLLFQFSVEQGKYSLSPLDSLLTPSTAVFSIDPLHLLQWFLQHTRFLLSVSDITFRLFRWFLRLIPSAMEVTSSEEVKHIDKSAEL